MWLAMIVLLTGALLGFITGLATFQRSLMWCRECGQTLSCPHCAPGRTRHYA